MFNGTLFTPESTLHNTRQGLYTQHNGEQKLVDEGLTAKSKGRQQESWLTHTAMSLALVISESGVQNSKKTIPYEATERGHSSQEGSMAETVFDKDIMLDCHKWAY